MGIALSQRFWYCTLGIQFRCQVGYEKKRGLWRSTFDPLQKQSTALGVESCVFWRGYYVPGDFSPEFRLLNFIGYLGVGSKKGFKASEALVGCELLGFVSSF